MGVPDECGDGKPGAEYRSLGLMAKGLPGRQPSSPTDLIQPCSVIGQHPMVGDIRGAVAAGHEPA